MDIFWGLAIPYLGTTLGSAMVFFMKNKINNKIEKLLLGFASGVMIAASIWSLIMPSIDMAEEQGVISWIPATIGFLLGIFFLLILDSIIPHLHLNSNEPEGMKEKIKKTTMMVLAVTLHNIPEGMADEYHNYWFHIKGSIIGEIIGLLVCLIVGVIVTLL